MPSLDFYEIFMGIFTLAGIVTAAWGWRIIVKAKKTQKWPSVEGVIEKSKRCMEHNDLLQEVVFSYEVDGRRRTRIQEFPRDMTTHPQFTESYLEKYPAGAKVPVYYDPADPDRATLEVGFISGDWMIFVWGLGMIAIGIVFLVAGG